jgi:hypothetical protein
LVSEYFCPFMTHETMSLYFQMLEEGYLMLNYTLSMTKIQIDYSIYCDLKTHYKHGW